MKADSADDMSLCKTKREQPLPYHRFVDRAGSLVHRPERKTGTRYDMVEEPLASSLENPTVRKEYGQECQ